METNYKYAFNDSTNGVLNGITILSQLALNASRNALIYIQIAFIGILTHVAILPILKIHLCAKKIVPAKKVRFLWFKTFAMHGISAKSIWFILKRS